MPKKSPYPDVEIRDVSFQDLIFPAIKQYEDDIAIIDNTTGDSITFSKIYSQSRRLAVALCKRGLKKGDVVGICAPSSTFYSPILLAAASCGAALTTCNPDYTVGEILLQFRQAKPVMVFSHMKSLERMKKVAEEVKEMKHIFPLGETSEFESFTKLIETSNEADYPSIVIDTKKDILLMPYSSGTTGLPKCVMMTHATTVASLQSLSAHSHIFRTSMYYIERPMFHGGGLYPLMSTLFTGNTLITDVESDIHRILQAVEKYQITHTVFVPPILIQLSNNKEIFAKYDLSSLKVIYCGGSSVPVGLMVELGKKMNVKIQQGYGMTECPIAVSDPVVDDPESVGMIISNAEIKIIDISTGEELGEGESGEILVNGPFRMAGYYQNPEATAKAIDKDGWLHTGDIGRYNKDGMMFVTGRLKEVIKYRTFQVPPSEIEEVLLNHPDISDVGVVGVPHPEAGEVPRALVVRKCDSLTGDDVKKLIERELSDYKHLRGGVQFVDSIPKSVLGKILRQDLKKMVKM